MKINARISEQHTIAGLFQGKKVHWTFDWFYTNYLIVIFVCHKTGVFYFQIVYFMKT